MEARDFRSIGRPPQEAQDGSSQAAAARAVGVQRQTVNLWLKR